MPTQLVYTSSLDYTRRPWDWQCWNLQTPALEIDYRDLACMAVVAQETILTMWVCFIEVCLWGNDGMLQGLHNLDNGGKAAGCFCMSKVRFDLSSTIVRHESFTKKNRNCLPS